MVKPIGDRVLVLPDDPTERRKSGIYQAKAKSKENQTRGKIISVGEGSTVQQFKKGDILIFEEFGPQDVIIEKVKHRIVHYDQILAKEA